MPLKKHLFILCLLVSFLGSGAPVKESRAGDLGKRLENVFFQTEKDLTVIGQFVIKNNPCKELIWGYLGPLYSKYTLELPSNSTEYGAPVEITIKDMISGGDGQFNSEDKIGFRMRLTPKLAEILKKGSPNLKRLLNDEAHNRKFFSIDNFDDGFRMEKNELGKPRQIRVGGKKVYYCDLNSNDKELLEEFYRELVRQLGRYIKELD